MLCLCSRLKNNVSMSATYFTENISRFSLLPPLHCPPGGRVKWEKNYWAHSQRQDSALGSRTDRNLVQDLTDNLFISQSFSSIKISPLCQGEYMVNVTATTSPEVYSLVGKNGAHKNDQKQSNNRLYASGTNVAWNFRKGTSFLFGCLVCEMAFKPSPCTL